MPEFAPRLARREACVGSPILADVADEVDGAHLRLDGVSERYVSGPAVASAAISRGSQASPRCWRVNFRARSDSITSTFTCVTLNKRLWSLHELRGIPERHEERDCEPSRDEADRGEARSRRSKQGL